MLSQGRAYRYFYYIPGIVVLFLSLFALYSAAQLVETRRTVRERYKYYAAAFMDMEDVMHNFEKTFLAYVSEDPNAPFSEVKKEFGMLNSKLETLQENRYVHLNQIKDSYLNYELTLYRVNMEMARMADFLNVYEKGEKEKSLRDNMMYVQHENLEDIHNNVNKLQDIIIRSFVYAVLEGRIKEKEAWLYWLIFIMGVCGFALLIANSGKLKEVEKLNLEKEDTVELLQERLAAMEAATDGIFVVNSQGKMTYMNSAFFSIISGDPRSHSTHYSINNFLDKPWQKVFSPSDVEVLKEDIIPELEEKGMWLGPFQFFTHKGTNIWTDMSLTKLPEGGIVGTVQDVTYKKQAEQEKQQLEEQFHQAQKMEAIGRLAGGIAHDFNNILAAMNGYAEFLIDDLEEGSDQRKFAQNILQAGRQARSLVDQMLAFSRRSSPDQGIVDVRKSLEEVVGMISVSLPKTIELKTEITPEYMLVSGNPTQISQVIMNLCVNAQDAIEEEHGNLYISLEAINTKDVDIPGVIREEMPDPSETPYMRIDDIGVGHSRMVIGHLMRNYCYAKVVVQDSGTGISHAIMEHIFEPFFTTKPVDKGTGLGLSTVHGALAAHRSFMVLDSKLGVGTRFEVYFPLIAESDENSNVVVNYCGNRSSQQSNKNTENEASEFDDEEISDISEVKTGKKKTKKLNILLVEDQENVRDMIITMVGRLGHKVYSAENGIEGLDMIRENPDGYDIIITDYNMPKMTGLEMAHQISLDLPDLRFVLLSGYSKERMQELIKDHPSFRAVLRKPVSKKVLGEIIEEVMKN